jgi:hypothetical protein
MSTGPIAYPECLSPETATLMERGQAAWEASRSHAAELGRNWSQTACLWAKYRAAWEGSRHPAGAAPMAPDAWTGRPRDVG